MTTRAAVELRTLAFRQFRRDEAARTGHLWDRHRLDGRVAALGRHRVEAGGAHGQHLPGLGAAHGGQRVAGIDRPHEGVGADDRRHVAHDLHIQQRAHPRHHVLALGAGRCQQMRIGRCQRHQQGGHRLGQQVVEHRRIGHQHARHAGQLRRRRRGGGHAVAGHQHMHLAQLLRRRHGRAGGLLDGGAVVIEEHQHRHGQITFASVRSFATSSATEATFLPAWRFGGSTTCSTVSRGAGSTPSSAGVSVAIGFLRAFMMLGRLA